MSNTPHPSRDTVKGSIQKQNDWKHNEPITMLASKLNNLPLLDKNYKLITLRENYRNQYWLGFHNFNVLLF